VKSDFIFPILDLEVRLTAIAHLGQQADHEALRVLLEIVEDPDPDVLQSAVAALEVLVQRAEDREVQQLAAETIGIVLESVTAEAVHEPMTKVPGE
jgi:HEAT repeat protein